ncbi:MAG: succinate dehydrogenase iron-sulfur subunit [Thermodesulfobacteriota bacterium]
MKITLHIARYNPETDDAPYTRAYEIDAGPTDRLLDALMHVKNFVDSTLSFRKSCAHGVCGSDAMQINGKERLACKTLIKDLADSDGATITIEPLRHFPVLRDLIVDQTNFFEKYRSVQPYLINDEPPPEKERIQSPEQRAQLDDSTNCILCMSCFSACPIFEKNPGFIGPAVIAQAHRFNEDSRDRGFEQRLDVLDTPDGVWSCENHFECTKCCPRGIKVTKRINQTARRIKANKG